MLNGGCSDNYGQPVTLDDFQLYLITQYPSLFATAFMHEPDTGGPWKMSEEWQYQAESADYLLGDVVHEDAAEVGKTREITVLLLWSSFTNHGGRLRKPVSLVGAPLSSHLGEISRAIEEQVELNPDLKAITRLKKGKRWKRYEENHLLMEFNTGAWIFFRPSGSDGNAFRGIHANAFVKMDEATKLKNPMIWSEFWRAMKPTATSRIYSVPDGDRSCDFYSQCQQAMPFEEFKRRHPDGYTGKGKPPTIKFNWPKSLMPDPFWNEARRRYFIGKYHGEDSSGYVRNCLGGWGDPESTAFPWSTFGPCLTDIPEYRRLKVMVDAKSGEVSLELTRFEAIRVGNKLTGNEVLLWDRREPLSEWADEADRRTAIENIVFSAFADMPKGDNWCGADLGQTRDPTEIMVKLERGNLWRLHTRINLRGVEYQHQAEFIRAVDMLADPDAERPAWGIDPGSAGTTVIGILSEDRFADRDLAQRATGYAFGGGYDAVDLAGEVIMTKNEKKDEVPLRQNGKELSTDLLTMAMQARRAQYSLDPELSLYYPSHTYKQGSRWRIFATVDDHTIDADRQLMLNRVLAGDGGGDSFACGAHER